MSYEMAFFKRFIEEPNRYRPYYQYVSNLALNVNRVMKQAREKQVSSSNKQLFSLGNRVISHSKYKKWSNQCCKAK